MKKLFALFLTFAFVCALSVATTGCTKDKDKKSSTPTVPTTGEKKTDTSTDTTKKSST